MSTDTKTVSLRIDGQHTATDATLPDWPAEVFAIDGLARGAAEAAATLEVPEDAVLELELASGERILVAAADAGRYLAPPPGRGADEAGVLRVGTALAISGARPLPGLARDGLGGWIVKSLRVFRQGPAGMTAFIAAGTFQDAQLGDRDGLYRCAGDAFGLTQADALPAADAPALLFIHGTASSTEGSFAGLWRNDNYRKQMADAYGQRIYAFEHRSLTESPIDNALALARTLPKGARLHVVSHSRGGMVGELLARANRLGAEPFADEDIERFLAQAERGGRAAFDVQAEALRQLNRELTTRGIRIERFVRVACPTQGTTLASGRLDRWASAMLNLLGKGFDAAGKLLPGAQPLALGYGLLKKFLLAVVRQRCDARVLPGLEAMMPDSPLVALLNAPDVRIDAPLHVVAGDFAGAGLLPWLGDCLSEVFYGGETDLVVNTPSMSGGADRARGIRRKSLRGPRVTHFTYFDRDESALPLLAALRGNDADFETLPGPSQAPIARGGKQIKAKADAPIAFLLPGIMGSHIRLNNDRIWFDPVDMWAGHMARLRVDAKGVAPDGWLDMSYEGLARHLAESHELRPFAYDWRLSIVAAAARFGSALDAALAETEKRAQPLRIVAHSMGGLVARLALQTRWERFKRNPGNRLLQLGTPNRGSHAIAAVLLGRDDFVQKIERWFDWKHDMSEFLDIVRDFPGVLELLPWPDATGKADDGVDYFDAARWQDWHGQDADPKKDKTWLPPRAAPLQAARQAIAAIQAAALDPERTIYVAGRAPTPCAVRLADGRVEIGWSDEGDGRVPWKTGIPPGVPVWYVDAAHGDLAAHQPAFDAYRELIERGSTAEGVLKRLPSAVRGALAPGFRPRGLEGHALYPSADEVLAAAIGAARPGTRAAPPGEPPAEIVVVHGSLAGAEAPVLIGAYAHDGLRGSARFLDGHLGGQLARSHKLGLYPAETRDAKVFLNPVPHGRPGGAIVVGLGPVGALMPGELTRTLTGGLLEYARGHDQCHRPAGADFSGQVEVSALLVGTGFTGLTVEAGARCLAEALCDANAKLAESNSPTRIARLTLFEEAEGRAIAAVAALRETVRDARFAALRFDGRLRDGVGGYRGRCIASEGQPGAYRVLIAADGLKGGLRFTVIGDRARNEVAAEPDQRQAIDGLIAAATGSLQDSPRLSCALFQLMVPNGMKAAVAELRTLMLSVEPAAAAYPWELMRDTGQADMPPLAARVELVRQLATIHGRPRPPIAAARRAFVVGDTRSGRAELPGAQQEATLVAKTLREHDIDADLICRADAREVFEGLLCGDYRFLHLAGHGEVEDQETGLTGMVLGPKTFLTAAQVAKLPYVPEFVFLNCCHLGDMRPDAAAERRPRWGELAANLAAQFIEIGCKAVVAAGWAVDDRAAETFAQTFYTAMLAGKRFGQAVLAARAATHARHPAGNTWGAFQAYGDERYRFPVPTPPESAGGYSPLPSDLVADLDKIAARLQGATDAEKQEYYGSQLAAIETAARNPDCRTAVVEEKLGAAWSAFGDQERAIAHYRAALDAEHAGASIRAIESLANLEIRQGAKLAMAADKARRSAGAAYLKSGADRLELLLRLGETAERLALFGSYWKRLAMVAHARGEEAMVADYLSKMCDAYRRAAEHARRQTGEWDYYPLFNALDGALLLAARGNAGAFDALVPDARPARAAGGKAARRAATGLPIAQLRDLLAAGAANGQRRHADDRDFFHALAPVEAKRIEILLAALANDKTHRAASAEFFDAVVADYKDALRRNGTAREHDSVLDQPRFLLDLLPAQAPQGLQDALHKLVAALGK